MNELTSRDLGVEDKKIYDAKMASIVTTYEELFNLVNFPPFRLTSNFETAEKYISELKSEYQTLRSLRVEDLLDTEFKPFRPFIRKRASLISQARDYVRRSNNNMIRAVDMYAADNPSAQIGDDEYYLPEQTPW